MCLQYRKVIDTYDQNGCAWHGAVRASPRSLLEYVPETKTGEYVLVTSASPSARWMSRGERTYQR